LPSPSPPPPAPENSTADDYFQQGNEHYSAGNFAAAITSYDYALQLKPDKHEAWNNRGSALGSLGQHELAIASYDHALQIKPDYHFALSGRGVALDNLGQHEAAIASYDQVLQIKPDNHEAWNNRGVALNNLGQHEAAIASYDQALQIKPDDHVAWFGRGIALDKLGQYEAAIASYDKALQIKPDFHTAWFNRAAAFCGWSQIRHLTPSLLSTLEFSSISTSPNSVQQNIHPHITALQAALPHLAPQTYGLGYILEALGDAYRKHAGEDPKQNWREAYRSYTKALICLTEAEYPRERLKVLQKLIQICMALDDLKDGIVDSLQRQGAALREQLRTTLPELEQAQFLQQYASFGQTTVDLLVRQGHGTGALETAEADKNALMSWLVTAHTQADAVPQLAYAAMRRLLQPHRAIVYWHLSAEALTTFILHPDHTEPIPLIQPTATAALQQRDQLTQLLTTWNRTYAEFVPKKDGRSSNPTWRETTLPATLSALADLLQIDLIQSHLQSSLNDPITELILVPHRELHRLPLEALFPQACTRLPSLQVGLDLSPAPRLDLATVPSLSIEAPTHTGTDPLYHASVESHLLQEVLPQTTLIPSRQAQAATVLAQLQNPTFQILHFNGHARHDFDQPHRSALGLTGDDTLTAREIVDLDLAHFQLVTLASCETAIAGDMTIASEAVSLTTALLASRIPAIVSTLWSVESAASALFMLTFYQHLADSMPISQAFHTTQEWLRRVSVADLQLRAQTLLQSRPPRAVQEFLETWQTELSTMKPEATPYQEPYYWAAFTLTGVPDAT
ncbi:MAG: CHAT domain-containing tetratricopeptide repeat protein, partial [Leptolyngbyaceae cyanobacterium bins.302]|nr:CHAT domain-containing tetratricopeptide repeat protein [Leptolyngbyaceae cyanobacterium bins.302]